MAVDVDELKASITDWASKGAGQALDDLRQGTHDRCPFGVSEDGGTGQPHLLDTEEAIVTAEGEQWTGTLAYTAEHASYLDEGSEPHLIEGNPLLSFMWNGQRVIVHSVQHPGSTIHKGWFSDVTGEDDWANVLSDALDKVEAV